MMNETVNQIVIEDGAENTPVARRFVERFRTAEITFCPSPAERRRCAARIKTPKTAVYLGRRRGPYIKDFPHHVWHGEDGGCGTNLILGYNCSASCRYCFVQTIFEDPMPTIFVDSAEMAAAVQSFLGQNPRAGVSTGEYMDSLLFDDITRYTEALMEVFAPFSEGTLELRTKSAQIDHLPADPIPQILVSYSINPADVVVIADPGAPDLVTRLTKAMELYDRGYRIALRIDPIIAAVEFETGYRELPAFVEKHLGWHRVCKAFLGILRFDSTLLERMTQTSGGRRLLDAEYVPCPDGYFRPFRGSRTGFYKRLVQGIREYAPRMDISITMEPDYVRRAALNL